MSDANVRVVRKSGTQEYFTVLRILDDNDLDQAKKWLNRHPNVSYSSQQPEDTKPEYGWSINAATGSLVIRYEHAEKEVIFGDVLVKRSGKVGAAGAFFVLPFSVFYDEYIMLHPSEDDEKTGAHRRIYLTFTMTNGTTKKHYCTRYEILPGGTVVTYDTYGNEGVVFSPNSYLFFERMWV